MIQHFFYRQDVEEYWKTKHSDISREDFSTMMQDKIWVYILKYPYNPEAQDLMPFGQYKDTPIKQIYKDDSDYLVWVLWIKRDNENFMKMLCENVGVGPLMKMLFSLR
jgi:hypothetical protein